MKKIYSIMLMAVALLISTNLKAVEHAASSQALLQQYLDEATSGDVIKLTDDIHLTSQLYFYREKGTKITLDLNGKTIDNNSAKKPTRLVRIYRGELLITSSNGTGYISQNFYEGVTTTTYLMDIFGTAAQGEAAENHTVVTIDQNVTLVNNCHAISDGKEKAYGYGISILELRNAYFMKDRNENVIPNYVSVFKEANGTTTTSDGFANGIVLTIKGRIEASKYCIKVNGLVRTPNYMLEKYNYTNTKYDVSEIESPSLTGKNAIVLGAEGAYDLSDNAAALACAPKVTIAATAELEGMANVSNSTSVYASGLGDWTIEGTVTGNTPVWIRTGNVTIDGATIQSTSTVYQAVDAARSGSGTDAIGSAIVIETDARYSNESSLTIKGDANIEANTGYAIEEAIHNNAGEVAEVNAINLEGGSFTGGNQGLIHITTSTLDNHVTTVSGGQFDNYTEQDNATITSIITGEDNHAIYVNNGTGIQPTLVVGQGDAPAQVDATFSFAEIDPLDSVSVDLSAVTAGELTLDANLTILKDLVMNGTNAVTIIVKEEQTLAVRQLTMAASAKIIVEPGGKLIIYGTNGITANSVNNIVVEASEAAQGQVLFNPDVKSGRHPKATVQYTASSYRIASPKTDVVEFIGHPMYNAQIEEISIDKNYIAQFQVWNGAAYENLGFINYPAGTPQINDNLAAFNKDFGFYALFSNNPKEDAITISFKGNVNGNNNAEFTLGSEDFTAMSNGYLAQMNENALYTQIKNWGLSSASIYLCTVQNNHPNWSSYNPYHKYGKAIHPMATMMVNNQGNAAQVAFNYKNLVWDPANVASAPARQDDSFTKAAIRMSNTTDHDQLVIAEIGETIYNAPEYMNNVLNFFVNNDKQYDFYGTENVENVLLGYSATEAGQYTLTFDEVQGDALVLVDLINGARTNIEEGAEYTFTVSANETNEARFQVVKERRMPTAIETIEAVKAQKGIYNLVGAYLGEDFDALPAGIYVVNGVKVVK